MSWWLSNSPQCEWTTRRVQKMASVTGVVQMNGTMNAGICAADTTFGKESDVAVMDGKDRVHTVPYHHD